MRIPILCLICCVVWPAAMAVAQHNEVITVRRHYISSGYPCDTAASAGTPCVAAHSVTRRLFAAYSGNIFQIERASDSTTLNIGTLSNGCANTSGVATFCSGTTCRFSEIYDQAGNGNNLPQATFADQAPYATISNALCGTVPIVETVSGEYYRNRSSTTDIPTGSSQITEYMAVSTGTYATCCGTYGDMENYVGDAGSGTMFALAFGTGAEGTDGVGPGPWGGVDWENGVYYNNSPTLTSALAVVLAKYAPSGPSWTLKTGSASYGSLTTYYSGALPSGYTAAFQGGISLGEGGDGSAAPVAFLEGAILASTTTDATDNAMQSNIARFYAIGSTPTFSPGAGSYSSPQTVTISTTAGSVLCYNTTGAPATNGTTGCTTGTLYTTPLTVSSTETLYAVAGGTGYVDSPVGSASYLFGSYVLDELTASSEAAYSLRQLRSEYTGYAIQVTRSSDSTTDNIGFTSGVLNTSALLSFCAATNCYVTTWYDQSGNGYNATISGNHNEIVASGSLVEQNGLPAVAVATSGGFSGTGFSPFLSAGAISINAVANIATGQFYPILFGNNLVATASGAAAVGTSSSSGTLDIFRTGQADTPISDAEITLGELQIATFTSASGLSSGSLTMNAWANGTGGGSGTVSGYGTQATGFSIMQTASGNTSTGYISEIVIFPSALGTTDRQTLEHNQESYYTISGS